MTRVFPEPAPARMSSGPFTWSTAWRCSGFRASRKLIGTRGLGPGARDVGAISADCLSRAYHRPAIAPRFPPASARQAEPRPRAPDLWPLIPPLLFDRDALGQIARLIDVASAADRDV